jgi:hypothetical protein
MPKRAKLANFRSTVKVPHGSENLFSFANIFQMKMDIFDKSAVVDGRVLEVCNLVMIRKLFPKVTRMK